jgi:hypothetical protein
VRSCEKRLLTSCRSVRPSVCVRFDWTDLREIWYQVFYENMSNNPNLVKIGQNIGHCTRKPKDVSLFPATLRSSKSSLSDCNISRLLDCPSVHPSACLSTCISMAGNGRTGVKSYRGTMQLCREGINYTNAPRCYKYMACTV